MRLFEILKEVGDHFGSINPDDRRKDPYYGRNIIWYGEKGRMVKVTPQNSEPMWGNIFDNNKINDTAKAIRNSEDRAEFNAPLAHITIIDILYIEENLQANEHGDLMYDPAIDDVHIFTTGDDELDAYLLNSEEFLDDNSYDDEERQELEAAMENYKKQAQAEEWGDVGNLHITLRDGNHRRVAAFRSGEPFIWATVATQGLKDERAKKFMQ